METDARVAATIPANQVAMIKVFSSFLGGNSNASGGVLAIYTKKGADLSSTYGVGSDVFNFKGYSVIREFYSPDYNVNHETIRADERITLQWLPDVMVMGVNSKLPLIFYNNDRTKSYKVIVEGMTAEGKLVFIEKIITPGKKAF